MDKKHRIYTMSFAKVYPMYVQKAVRKGHTKQEVDEIIFWLTGHNKTSLENVINKDIDMDMEIFFAQAPKLNPARKSITGMICGVRIESIEDEIIREIRYLDKLVDELVKGKDMAKIKRFNA